MTNSKIKGLLLVSLIIQIVTIISLIISFTLILTGNIEISIGEKTDVFKNFSQNNKTMVLILFIAMIVLSKIGLYMLFKFKQKTLNNEIISVGIPLFLLIANIIVGIIVILIWKEKQNQNE